MLDKKELEQISEIVRKTQKRNEDNDGCGVVFAFVVCLLAIWGAFTLAVAFFS